MDPDRSTDPDDAVATLRRWLELGFRLASTSDMDFFGQLDAMTREGVPDRVAGRFVNLIPILAGRRFLASGGPSPKLADHYVLVDRQGNEQQVRFAECNFSQSIEWYLDRSDPIEVLGIGVRSCEVVALNNMLTRMGPQATESSVAAIEIVAPRMGG